MASRRQEPAAVQVLQDVHFGVLASRLLSDVLQGLVQAKNSGPEKKFHAYGGLTGVRPAAMPYRSWAKAGVGLPENRFRGCKTVPKKWLGKATTGNGSHYNWPYPIWPNPGDYPGPKLGLAAKGAVRVYTTQIWCAGPC